MSIKDRLDVDMIVAAAKKYCADYGLDYSKIDMRQLVHNAEGDFVLFCKTNGKTFTDGNGLAHDIDTQPYLVLIGDAEGHITETEETYRIK